MPKKKVYGQSARVMCPFCGRDALTRNAQGLPTCNAHRSNEINLKCACGDYLDVKESKYGTFFTCIACGAVSYAKGLEMNNLPLGSVNDL
jgi:hypothetical protein